MKKIEKKIMHLGRKVRFTNFIDEQSRDFEISADQVLPEVSFEQQIDYLAHTRREYYLLQISDSAGSPTFRASVYVSRPRYLNIFATANVPGFGQGLSPIEESIGIDLLSELVTDISGVMTLRIQPRRLLEGDLMEFVGMVQSKDFLLSEPLGPSRTLLINLLESADTLVTQLPKKTRAKVCHASREKLVLSDVTDPKHLQSCNLAMSASRKRSGGTDTAYDFEAAFEYAKAQPSQAKFIGLFLKDAPERLLAYGIAFRTGKQSEFSSAGALSEPEIRAFPYNYFIFWELMNWARLHGSSLMDMGGITSGDDTDPLRGISRFKRSFPGVELEISREAVKVLSPVYFAFYSTIKTFLSGFNWKNPVSSLERKSKILGAASAYD